MSVLSITAPQFTAEDEQLERDNLTQDEMDAAVHDIYGTGTLEETEEMRIRGPMELEAALQDIPMEEKEAYLEAVARVPEIVEAESNFLLFLRSEDYNVWAAAERLVNYWELRRWLFGDRAWLPMTQTGNGALSDLDIELLRHIPATLLRADKMDRVIVYFEESRVDPTMFDRIAFVRVIFYFLSVVLEDEAAQKKGIIVLANTKDYHTSRFDRKYYKYLTYLFTGYHPVNTRAFHVCAPAGKSCYLLVLPFIKYFMTKHLRLRFKLHTGTNGEVAMDLADFGMDKKYLPESMGGEYQFESFHEWIQERLIVEAQREKTLAEQHEQYVAAALAAGEGADMHGSSGSATFGVGHRQDSQGSINIFDLSSRGSL